MSKRRLRPARPRRAVSEAMGIPKGTVRSNWRRYKAHGTSYPTRPNWVAYQGRLVPGTRYTRLVPGLGWNPGLEKKLASDCSVFEKD